MAENISKCQPKVFRKHSKGKKKKSGTQRYLVQPTLFEERTHQHREKVLVANYEALQE